MAELVPICLICESKQIIEDDCVAQKLGLTNTGYGVKKCPRCDWRWLSPRPDSEEYKEMYQKSAYFSDANFRDTYEQERNKYYTKKCQKIQKLINKNPGKLLDIGSGTGEFVAIAKEKGIEAKGLEISPAACQIAKQKHNIDLECGDIFHTSFSEGDFDVIQIHHVLEHVLQPVEFLNKARKMLKKDGLLVLEVPYQFDNALEIIKKVLGIKEFPPYSPASIHHPFFFSPRSLTAILEKCGFRVIYQNTFAPDNPVSEAQSNSRLKGLVKTIILGCGGIIGKGDFIEVYAKLA